jgi:hypothetical protein
MNESASCQRATPTEPGSRLTKWFLLSAGGVLAVTGIAKIWSTFGQARLMAVTDPLLGLTFGHLMVLVGGAELGIALACLFSRRQALLLGLVAWLATNFVVYRLGLRWMDWHRPCGCMGNLTDALHLSPQLADSIMKGILGYLLVGSYALLVRRWRH